MRGIITLAIRPVGQAAKTPPSQGGNMGSIPVRVTKNKEALCKKVLLLFLERCVPHARNVLRTSCVMTASPCDVPFGREAEHIASLCAPWRNTSLCQSRYALAQHHLPARANTTLYKNSKLCYNIIECEVLVWLNQNCVNYQWTFPLIL